MAISFDKFGNIVNSLVSQTEGELQARGADFVSDVYSAVANNVSSSKSEKLVPDHRVRISPKPGLPGDVTLAQKKSIFGPLNRDGQPVNNLMKPLYSTNGVIFPYTPVITATLQADYSQYAPVHANQDFHTYQRTPSAQYNIAGTFTAQNDEEARYALAVIHFFRTITKMDFGKNGTGLAPPVLMLNGYGKYMFNNLPIIINNYTVELMSDIDYVKVDIDGTSNIDINGDLFHPDAPRGSSGQAWIPSRFLITVNCIVQHTPQRLREFDLDKFRTGELMKKDFKKGGWW